MISLFTTPHHLSLPAGPDRKRLPKSPHPSPFSPRFMYPASRVPFALLVCYAELCCAELCYAMVLSAAEMTIHTRLRQVVGCSGITAEIFLEIRHSAR